MADPIGTAMFATLADLAARMAVTEFSELEETQAEMLLALATQNITAAVDKTDEWAAELSPVPGLLKSLCVELVTRVMVNPTGVRSQSEQLGSYQYSTSYTDDSHTLELSPSEELRARRIVWGTNSASAQAESTMDVIADVVLDDVS